MLGVIIDRAHVCVQCVVVRTKREIGTGIFVGQFDGAEGVVPGRHSPELALDVVRGGEAGRGEVGDGGVGGGTGVDDVETERGGGGVGADARRMSVVDGKGFPCWTYWYSFWPAGWKYQEWIAVALPCSPVATVSKVSPFAV